MENVGDLHKALRPIAFIAVQHDTAAHDPDKSRRNLTHCAAWAAAGSMIATFEQASGARKQASIRSPPTCHTGFDMPAQFPLPGIDSPARLNAVPSFPHPPAGASLPPIVRGRAQSSDHR